MVSYILRRVLATLPVMAIVAFFVFSLLYIAPGDPAAVIAGDQASPADVERIRQSLGLDQPFLVQFWTWLWRILHGDLGTSIFTNLPVSALIAQRIEPTVSLMAITLVLTIVIAVPLGVLAAWKAGSWIDRAIMAAAAESGFMVVHGFPVDIQAGAAVRADLLRILGLPEDEIRKLWRQKFAPAHANIYRGWFPLQTGFLTAKEGIDMGADVAYGSSVVCAGDPLRESTPLPITRNPSTS